MEFVQIINKQQVRHVEIRIGNTCNFDCSFCSPEFKSGSRRALDVEAYKSTVKTLMSNNLLPTLFTIQGGEPTLYPKIAELLSYIKELGGYTQMFSNGSRTMRWWEEFLSMKLLDRLIVSHHSEQAADPVHTAKVLKLAKELLEETSCHVTVTKEKFNSSVDDFNTIKSLTTDIAVTMVPIVSDMYVYTNDELETIKNNNRRFNSKESGFITRNFFGGIQIISKEGKIYDRYGYQLLLSQENKFNGWECDVGILRLVIETDEAYVGICKVGGVIGKVSEQTVAFQKQPIICNVNDCVCGADAIIPKRKPA